MKVPKYQLVGNGIAHVVSNNTKIVCLYDNINAASAADGFLDQFDGNIYQVPNGKTFHVTNIIVQTSTATDGTITIYNGNTQHGLDGVLFVLNTPALIGHFSFPVNITLLATKFLTYNPGSTFHSYIFAHGYETWD